MTTPASTARPRVTILRHSVLDGPGHLADYFDTRGWETTIVDTPHDDFSALDPLAPDLLLPLGSGLSVYDEALFPFIAAERELLARRIAAGRAVLGICFGAQLIASALGARVYRAPEAEIGWYPLALTPEAAGTPIARLAPPATPAVMHWHQDTFDLPEGCTRLATSALCKTQAYARGPRLLALQFHPEVTRRGVEAWLAEASFTPETRAARTAEIRAGAARCQPAMQAETWALLDEWLPAARA